MPYYVHPSDREPRTQPIRERAYGPLLVNYTGCDCPSCRPSLPLIVIAPADPAFEDKQQAIAARPDNRHTITFVCDPDQRRTWQRREERRYTDNMYADVPWGYAGPSWEYDAVPSRYPHLSLKHPGRIAYTPNDESGVLDKQLVIAPGRYLQRFAVNADGSPYYDQSDIDRFCASVRAFSATTFNIARSTADIIDVYLNGPTSCMSHDLGDYNSNVHPVSVYGDSDLGIAYLGDKDTRVTARAVVWPDQQQYGRVYGDTMLAMLLEHAGWARVDSMTGARVRAIRHNRSTFVMPYVDGTHDAYLSRDGQWLFLGRDTDRTGTGYNTDNTNGLTGAGEEYYCAHCETEIDRDQTYCDDCNDQQWACGNCNTDHFDDDERVPVTIAGSRHAPTSNYTEDWCSDCADNYAISCTNPACDTEPFTNRRLSAQQRAAITHLQLCPTCRPILQQCGTCDTYRPRTQRACLTCHPLRPRRQRAGQLLRHVDAAADVVARNAGSEAVSV